MQEYNGTMDSATGCIKEDEVLSMNSDLQLKIFSYLAVVDRIEISKVCKTWKNIADAPILWKSIHFANVGRIMYRFQKDLERMLDMYPGVLELDLSQIPWAMAVDRVSLSPIFNAAVTLRSLRLHGGYWEGKLFISINEEFPNLERLHVIVKSAPPVPEDRVIGEGRALARPCVEIRHCNLLDLNLSGDWAPTAIVHCPKMHTLKIESACCNFNEYDDTRIVCPSITSLSLHGHHSLLLSFGFFRGVREAVPLLSSLLDLSLSLGDFVGPLNCLDHLTRLESLSVTGHRLRSCTVDLHSLRIASFDCYSLQDLSLRCPMIVDLRYKKARMLDVEIPQEDMLNLLSDSRGWDHLEVLHLQEYKFPASVVITFSQLKELELNDASGHSSMASLALDCPCLKKLVVSISTGLEDIDLHLPEAEEIILGSSGLKNLRVFAPRTQKFSVWGNPIQISAFDCPAVVDLALTACFWLEDSDLADLVLSCPLVHTLTIDGGYRLTPEGLEAAIRGWSNLTNLSLISTVVGSHITTIHASCPNLKSLRISPPFRFPDEVTDAGEDSEVQGWLALLGQSVAAFTSLDSIGCWGKECTAEVLINVLTHCVTSRTMRVGLEEDVLALNLPELPFQFVSTSQLRSFTLVSRGLSSVTCPKYSSWHQLEILSISDCKSLANVCLDCPNLKELDLTHSENVETLVLQCPKLTLLNVKRGKISLELVKEIEEYLPANFRLRDEFEYGKAEGGEASQYCTTFTLSSTKAWRCSLLVSLCHGLGNVAIVLWDRTSLHKIGEDRMRGHLIFGIGC